MFMSLLHHLMLRLSFGLGNSNAVERLEKMKPSLDAHWTPPTKKCVRKLGISYTLIGEFRWKKQRRHYVFHMVAFLQSYMII